MAVEEKVPVMKRESLKRRRLSSSNEDRGGNDLADPPERWICCLKLMKANDSVVSFFARSSKHSPCEAGYKELKRLLQVLAAQRCAGLALIRS